MALDKDYIVDRNVVYCYLLSLAKKVGVFEISFIICVIMDKTKKVYTMREERL